MRNLPLRLGEKKKLLEDFFGLFLSSRLLYLVVRPQGTQHFFSTLRSATNSDIYKLSYQGREEWRRPW